ncbi:MAG: DUF4381 domain-containing protein [Thiohalocapsa sp.]|nr:DUF4381 domain-containing protein [Thiohalocapsa sp.]
MFPEASQLRDIHDALGTPWWPLAPGWWLLLGAAALLSLLIWRFRPNWRLHLPIPFVTLGDWRWDAARALRRLRRESAGAPLKERVSALSELLRRIAMARQGRAACAGLHGNDWLDWLTRHDPRGFDWRNEGRLLLDAPYAPAAPGGADEDKLRRLLDAVEPWITVRAPRTDRPESRLRRLLPARRRTGAGAGVAETGRPERGGTTEPSA